MRVHEAHEMGLMDVPSFAAEFTFKVPAFAGIFYAFNTLAFSLGLMDAMLVPLLGTPVESLPIVTSSIVDALFMGFFVVNLLIGVLVYPFSFMNQETVKFQQKMAAAFYFGFLPVMYMMFSAGMMGAMGVGQYVVMNCIFGAFALYNLSKL